MVLVYCPFELLAKRVSRRNQRALQPDATPEEKADARTLFGVLHQFSRFYPFSTRLDGPVLEELTLEQINGSWALTDNEVALWQELAPSVDIEVLRKEEYQKMIENFNLQNGRRSFHIRPRFHYDIIVKNDATTTPEQCAMQIKQFMEQNTEFKAFQKNVQTVKQRGLFEKIKDWVKKRFVAQAKPQFNWRTKKQVFLFRG